MATKSSRIQQHRVRLPGTIVRTNSSGNNNGSNSTTSAADRLGMKALYLQRSQRSMALTHQAFQDALLLNANHAVNLGNYALFLYLDCGRHDQAQQFFERAIRADAHNTTNLAHYANFLKCVRGDIGRAEVLYLQALHLAPHDPDLIGNYAGLLAKTPDGKGKAKQLLREGLQKAPGHRRNILRLASLLSEQGQFEAAEAWLKQLLALLEADDPQHQSATTLTQSTVKWHLELAHVYGNYANLLRKQPQRWEDAKKMYGMAMQFNPTHPLLQRNLYGFASFAVTSLFLRDWKNHTKPKLSSV
ncbi:TPA: hypothetical protein N0F65_009457 [Lagenidium giganteum]|uniref:Uncharacterized protein n=1 Tax=Lagenidium giganteum TaxID=4803 RepID=A0AAV2ZBT0_9STRA|nr:TPA: hypothetical protein N0F65_009457 [Lagenidium giganteum]